MKVLNIYTDGGYRKTLKLGAYAYVIIDTNNNILREDVKIDHESDGKVTNNIMELKAVIKALNWIKSNGYNPNDHRIYVYTDSQYVQVGITDWIHRWRRNNWKNSKNNTVENLEYWFTLEKLFYFDFPHLHIQWIQGHDINKWNNKVDQLCTDAMLNFKKEKV